MDEIIELGRRDQVYKISLIKNTVKRTVSDYYQSEDGMSILDGKEYNREEVSWDGAWSLAISNISILRHNEPEIKEKLDRAKNALRDLGIYSPDENELLQNQDLEIEFVNRRVITSEIEDDSLKEGGIIVVVHEGGQGYYVNGAISIGKVDNGIYPIKGIPFSSEIKIQGNYYTGNGYLKSDNNNMSDNDMNILGWVEEYLPEIVNKNDVCIDERYRIFG